MVRDSINFMFDKIDLFGTNKMESDYNSVTEQAGIYAGNRGFDITVAGNTDLKGAVIDSKAGYEDNTLNTGTITFDDIENKAEYSTSGRGVNVQKTFGNKEGMTDEQKAWEGVTPSTGIGTKDEDESTTKSAIAEARINIMKPENQRQDITKLDRNTTRTLNKLGKIFDKDKVEEKQELAGLFQEMWHTTVGDLMAKSHVITDEQRKALNILGGAIAAELGGATTELLQSAFSQIKDPSLRKVAVAITAAMVAKGTGQEASTAANVGVAIQKYNHDLHPEETAEIMANVKQLTGEERDKYIKEWVKILEDKTEPDAFKVSISAGVGIVGVQKDFIFTKDANPEFFADDGTLDMKEVGKYIKDLVSKSSSYKPDLSFSISCSALHLVDLNDPNRKYNERDLNNILGGESYGISGYFLMGGGITKPYKPEAGNSGVVIIEKGGGTPQININFGIGENIGEVIKDKIKNPGQMD